MGISQSSISGRILIGSLNGVQLHKEQLNYIGRAFIWTCATTEMVQDLPGYVKANPRNKVLIPNENAII
jgi:hypothetical protein